MIRKRALRRIAGSTWWLLLVGLAATPSRAAEPLRVCLVSGSLEYKSNESLADLQKYLEANYDIRCSRAFVSGNDEEHLPGLENLDQCDVMLLFTRRLKLSGDELERFKRYCLAGKPIVGVRTASHAVQTWLDLDKQVLGGDYQGHYGPNLITKTSFTEAGRKHPILAGFEPFDSQGSLYKNPHVADDVAVLLTGSVVDAEGNPHRDPLAWTREYKGARIFYTSLGHPDDFAQPAFRRLLARALLWTAGRKLD
jgi:type 1 glutamine amidotransferase